LLDIPHKLENLKLVAQYVNVPEEMKDKMRVAAFDVLKCIIDLVAGQLAYLKTFAGKFGCAFD